MTIFNVVNVPAECDLDRLTGSRVKVTKILPYYRSSYYATSRKKSCKWTALFSFDTTDLEDVIYDQLGKEKKRVPLQHALHRKVILLTINHECHSKQKGF
jgi:hypothetical protein